jgi:GDPmannose 4,6-dehydratase
VIATGQTHSVKEFVEEAFSLLGLDWQKHVEIDPRYIRPTEVDLLLGDYSKARKALAWKPKVSFKELVRIMVEADLELAKREAHMNNYSKAKVKGVELRVEGSGTEVTEVNHV